MSRRSLRGPGRKLVLCPPPSRRGETVAPARLASFLPWRWFLRPTWSGPWWGGVLGPCRLQHLSPCSVHPRASIFGFLWVVLCVTRTRLAGRSSSLLLLLVFWQERPVLRTARGSGRALSCGAGERLLVCRSPRSDTAADHLAFRLRQPVNTSRPFRLYLVGRPRFRRLQLNRGLLRLRAYGSFTGFCLLSRRRRDAQGGPSSVGGSRRQTSANPPAAQTLGFEPSVRHRLRVPSAGRWTPVRPR